MALAIQRLEVSPEIVSAQSSTSPAGAGVGDLEVAAEEHDGMLALKDKKQGDERRDWLQPWTWPEAEWAKSKLKGPDHPLDANSVWIADKEVKTAIWGQDEPTQVTYMDKYDTFPFFCLTISVIQFLVYVLDVGFAEVSWSGPPSGPQTLWMIVYDENCDDLRHQVWRLWTYQWSHGTLSHVMGNCISNIIIGGELEAVHGSRNIAKLYTFGVITGALTCGAFQPHMPVIGSSGGVYTMIGARVINLVLNSDVMPNTLCIRLVLLGMFLLYDTISFFTSYSASSSYAAHAGGFLCGVLFGGYWLENFDQTPWELRLIKWFRRIYTVYMLFNIGWYISQPSGRPQGVFDSAGYCAYSN